MHQGLSVLLTRDGGQDTNTIPYIIPIPVAFFNRDNLEVLGPEVPYTKIRDRIVSKAHRETMSTYYDIPFSETLAYACFYCKLHACFGECGDLVLACPGQRNPVQSLRARKWNWQAGAGVAGLRSPPFGGYRIFPQLQKVLCLSYRQALKIGIPFFLWLVTSYAIRQNLHDFPRAHEPPCLWQPAGVSSPHWGPKHAHRNFSVCAV